MPTDQSTGMLLTPIDLGPVNVQNRVVSTAHGSFLDFYRPGIAPDQYVAYQERRARGGCGLIVLQAMLVHRSSQTIGQWMWERDDILPKLELMADRLHKNGTQVFVQLAHYGAQFRSDGNADLIPLWGFSPMLSPSGWEPSHEMTTEEVEEVLQGYEQTAAVALEAGLDGLEIHAAHGYLLQQSFSPWGNTRSDEWSEPLGFLNAVMQRVRKVAGSDKAVGLRISADDYLTEQAGGLGVEGLTRVASEACSTGYLDYLSHSAGARSAHYAQSIANYYGESGALLPLTDSLKKVSAELPVIAVGKILTPTHAEEILQSGRADLVAMTRAQIADPDLVVKYMSGSEGRIRPCVGANTGCVDRMSASLPITCFHNPEVGREATHAELIPAKSSRKVLVVGAGPAGLKAAEIASKRGHKVTVFDRASEPGGRLRWVRKLGKPEKMLGAVDWLVSELEILGVEVQLGVEVDKSLMSAISPDTVVLATGASGSGLDIYSDGSIPIFTEDQAMTEDVGNRVLFVDLLGYQQQSFVAEYLCSIGAILTIATPFPQVGVNIGFTHIRGHMERLYKFGAELRTSTAVTRIANGEVELRHLFSKMTEALSYDAVVAGTMAQADTSLLDTSRLFTNSIILAGDAVAPRTALHAFREGDDAGRQI